MDELEAIRQKRMQELNEQAQFQQQIDQLETIVKTLFTKEALSRYGNVKAAYPDRAVQILAIIGQSMQKGNTRKITDEDLKKMLVMIQPKPKQFKITRR